MKKSKTIICLFLVFSLSAVLLSGCGAKSPEDAIAEARKSMEEATSMSFAQTIDMALSVVMDGETTEFSLRSAMTVETTKNPQRIQADVTTDMGSMGSQSIKMYAEADDGQYSVNTSMDDGANWISVAPDTVDFAQINGSDSLALYLSVLQNITETGKETIDGASTTRYDCTIANDDLMAVLESSGALSELETLGLDESTVASYCAAMGDLPFSIWVDSKTYLPVRYRFDLGTAVNSVFDELFSSGSYTDTSVTMTAYTIEMTITGVNTISSIERPATLG